MKQQHLHWCHFEYFFFAFSDRYEYTKKMGTEGNLEKSYFKKWQFLSCCRQQKQLNDIENEREREAQSEGIKENEMARWHNNLLAKPRQS